MVFQHRQNLAPFIARQCNTAVNIYITSLGQWLEEVQIGTSMYTADMEILFLNFGNEDIKLNYICRG
jgi:hypothetical protein